MTVPEWFKSYVGLRPFWWPAALGVVIVDASVVCCIAFVLGVF